MAGDVEVGAFVHGRFRERRDAAPVVHQAQDAKTPRKSRVSLIPDPERRISSSRVGAWPDTDWRRGD
jgi:hypothetical protein